jgi:hypothetical protein
MNNQDIRNISRFYVKNNKVIDNPAEIERNKNINQFAFNAGKDDKKVSSFKGKVINRRYERSKENVE